MKRSLCALTLLASLVAGSLSFAADLDWPQWRGPQRTDISPATGLLKAWPQDGPKLVWTFEKAGLGYSSFAVIDGKLYTMGSRDNTELLICLDAASGDELWAAKVGEQLENGWGGGPRSTPTVDGEYVYGFGGKGNLVCVSRANGSVKWNVNVVETLGGKIPNWGYSESVLIDGQKVICTPGGGEGTIAALDKMTGEVIWQSLVMSQVKQRRSDELKDGPANAHYSSIMPTVINDEPQYVQLTQNLLFGVRAEDGKLLWKSPWPPGRTAVVPTPLIKDNYVYITSGYGAGCKLVKINADYSVDEVYFNTEMKNHHGGVILLGDTVYGHSDAGWIAQDFLSGETVWRERQKLGKGCVTYADGMLYCVDERSAEVALVEATRDEYREHGRFKLPKNSSIRSSKGKVWTHPVVINGMLFLRDQEYIFCYDVSAK